MFLEEEEEGAQGGKRGVPTHKRITEHLESQNIVGLKLCLSDALGQYSWEGSFRTWE